MGCTSSKEQAPSRPRPQIRHVQHAHRGRAGNGTEGDYNSEFWRQAHYMQERKLRDEREDLARAQGMGRTDEYGRRIKRYNVELR